MQAVRTFTFEETEDLALVKSIITHPAIYQGAKDDSSPPPAECDVLETQARYVLVRCDDGEIGGLFALWPHSRIVWEVHTCLLPHVWGEDALEIAKGLLAWTWDNTPCVRLVTSVPDCNRTALSFAKKSGMTEWGLNPTAFLKHGRYHAIHSLGITNPCFRSMEHQ